MKSFLIILLTISASLVAKAVTCDTTKCYDKLAVIELVQDDKVEQEILELVTKSLIGQTAEGFYKILKNEVIDGAAGISIREIQIGEGPEDYNWDTVYQVIVEKQGTKIKKVTLEVLAG